MDRIILHVDFNNFYATVECLHNPELACKPVAVCGREDKRHGIVLAKNELAKSYGVKTAEVIWQAKKKCSGLVIVEADMQKYIHYSKLAREIYERYTDKVESFGIDECWLDVTNSKNLFGDGQKIADRIRNDLKSQLGITASVGVSWNKVYAKLASDIKKPDATVVISRQNYKQKIFKLPVSALLYVGKATKEKLNKFGIFTIGDLAEFDRQFLYERLGKWGEILHRYASGGDTDEVDKAHEEDQVKSVGNSTTTVRDLTNKSEVSTIFTVLAESVASRLRAKGLRGGVLAIYLTDMHFKGWGKQKKLTSPTFCSKDLIATAMSLFEEFYDFNNPIRNVALNVSDLTSIDTAEQLNLFEADCDKKKAESLEQTIDALKQRFGKQVITRANLHSYKDLSDISIDES